MLKFRIFFSCISDPSTSHCSSSSSDTKGTQKSLIISDKGKAKVDHPSKTKTPNQKKDTKIKKHLQKSTPRLKIDLIIKNKEKISIPPTSDAKGLLGPGPADLKMINFKSPDAKHLIYRKCYHCGLNDHVASKCPNATKAEKLAKVKIISKSAKSAKERKSVKVESTAPDAETSAKALTNSSTPTNTKWVPKET